MHVVFFSNCELKAVPRTRALLDRYATRIGERAWATLITEQALDEVRSALRRSANRQTSVACYRSDAVLGLRPVWVVGNRKSGACCQQKRKWTRARKTRGSQAH